MRVERKVTLRLRYYGTEAYLYLVDIKPRGSVRQHMIESQSSDGEHVGRVIVDFNAEGRVLGVEFTRADNLLPANILEALAAGGDKEELVVARPRQIWAVGIWESLLELRARIAESVERVYGAGSVTQNEQLTIMLVEWFKQPVRLNMLLDEEQKLLTIELQEGVDRVSVQFLRLFYADVVRRCADRIGGITTKTNIQDGDD